MLLPVIGYVLIFNRNVLDHLQLAETFATRESAWQLTSEDKLFLLYVGGVCIAVATVIFQLRRPNATAGFTAEYDYFLAETKLATRSRIERIREEAPRSGAPDLQRFCHALDSELRNRPRVRSGPGDDTLTGERFLAENQEAVRDTLSASFVLWDRARPVARTIVFLFFGAGIVLIAVPSLELTLRVVLAVVG